SPWFIIHGILKPWVVPPVNWLTRISSNQRLHRRSNTLSNNPLRTTPKRAEELRRHANSMIGPCNLIQVLQPVLIQQCPTTSLLRIRVKHHQIIVITLIRYHIHKTRLMSYMCSGDGECSESTRNESPSAQRRLRKVPPPRAEGTVVFSTGDNHNPSDSF